MPVPSFFYRLSSLLMLVALCWGNGYAQSAQLGFEHLTMEQGLSSNVVLNMLVDSRGFLWAATMNGLDRYDGYGFTAFKFDPKDPMSLNQDLVFCMYEDDEGSLWVGTDEGGINKFDRHTEKFINYKPDQPPGRFETVLRAVSAINQDRQGMFWIGSHSGELRRFDKRTGRFSSFDYSLGYHARPGDLRAFDQITCIYRDREGELWIGNREGLHQLVLGRARGKGGSGIHFRHYLNDPADSGSLAGREVAGILEDHAGQLWVSTESALNRLDKKTGRWVHYYHLPSDPGSFEGNAYGNIVEDRDHNLWIATIHGIDRLDPGRGHFEHFRPMPGDPNSLNSGNTYHIVIDKADNIWVAGMGIDKLDPHQIPIITYKHEEGNPNSLNGKHISGVTEDHTGALWFATDSGLDVLDKKAGSWRHYYHDPADPRSLSSNLASCVLEDEKQEIWVSSWMGTLDRLDPRTGVFTHYIGDRGKFKNATRHFFNSLYEGDNGTIWIGEASNGVTAFDRKTGTLRHYGHDPADPKGMSDYQANCICEDRSGFIWIGHGSVATDRLDPRTGEFRHYQYHPNDTNGISSNYVNTIINDRKGNLWMGTLGGGLCKYDVSKDRFTTFTERDGLTDNSVNSIIEDNAGNLWLGTGNGLCRFSPDTRQFTHFDFLNSPMSNKWMRFLCKGRDGILYFGGEGGVKAFDPGQLRPNRYIPPVVITRFKLFNKARPANDVKEIELAHDQNFFSFEFSALNYTDPHKNQYAYKLEGFDRDWVFSGTRRTADYTAVPPGAYIFRVRGSNNEGLWNDEGVAIKIVIHPPWWQTWWARSVYVLCLVICWWLIDRWRRRGLIEKERIKSRAKELEMQALRAQMNPHFIFNCLSSINSFVLKNQTETASDYLTKFSRLIRTVLNNSKKSLISLEEEMDMLRLYIDMEKLRFNDGFVYSIEMDGVVDAGGILIPPLLFQPFVENAIWHGLMHKKEKGRLEIHLGMDGNMLICSIADNGVGRAFAAGVNDHSDSARKLKSMGIQITGQRLALVNGEGGRCGFEIKDLYDEGGNAAGTRVVLRVRTQYMNGG
jgi:ligand-binding sensor domain-containing protein